MKALRHHGLAAPGRVPGDMLGQCMLRNAECVRACRTTIIWLMCTLMLSSTPIASRIPRLLPRRGGTMSLRNQRQVMRHIIITI